MNAQVTLSRNLTIGKPRTALRQVLRHYCRHLLLLVAVSALSISSVASAVEAHQFVKLGKYSAGSQSNANGLNTIMEAFRLEAMADESGKMLHGIADAGWCYCRAGAMANIIQKSAMRDVELVGYAAFATEPERALHGFVWHVAPVVRIKSKPSLVWVADPTIGFATVPDWVRHFNRNVHPYEVELAIIPLDKWLRGGIKYGKMAPSKADMYQRFRDIASSDIPKLEKAHVERDFEMMMRVKNIVKQGGNGRDAVFREYEGIAEYEMKTLYKRMNLMKNEGAFVPEISVCIPGCGSCIVL